MSYYPLYRRRFLIVPNPPNSYNLSLPNFRNVHFLYRIKRIKLIFILRYLNQQFLLYLNIINNHNMKYDYKSIIYHYFRLFLKGRTNIYTNR